MEWNRIESKNKNKVPSISQANQKKPTKKTKKVWDPNNV